ncbi:glycerate kinase [Christiangramia crocea]|uniref:Glycerate kinase n=1 Tax=Christiangramia crocea TaxID=2904124 RepID=A0A9X1UVP3_9FLAO|nr:glycerate kinase [Gramella crocea]MCG9971272.1 glycerate kinase [Gramella crocea]
MKILIVPDSFKESLSAKKVAKAIAEGFLSVRDELEIEQVPFSDGGEGAFDLLEALDLGKTLNVDCQDPLGRKLKAPYFLFEDGKKAWIELSQASGLMLLQEKEQNPLKTSTYGTGLQLKHAIENGVRQIFLGIGGSATHDIASGIFSALGGKLLDKNGKELSASGEALIKCASIETDDLLLALKECEITVACDVTNSLLGENGAARTYAAQKGADLKTIEKLEKATRKFADLLEKEFHCEIKEIQGGGAAGGVSAGMKAIAAAKLKPGFEILSDLASLEEKIKKADLIITGEGKTDAQSKHGKLPFKIAELAKKHNKPVWLLAGSITAKKEELHAVGFTKIAAIKTENMPLEEAKARAFELLKEKTALLFKENQT